MSDVDRVRRIRVTMLDGESFILDVWRQRISGVTGEHRELLGADESIVAIQLKDAGAQFADVTDHGGTV